MLFSVEITNGTACVQPEGASTGTPSPIPTLAPTPTVTTTPIPLGGAAILVQARGSMEGVESYRFEVVSEALPELDGELPFSTIKGTASGLGVEKICKLR